MAVNKRVVSLKKIYSNWFYSILFYSILFYSILFYSDGEQGLFLVPMKPYMYNFLRYMYRKENE